MANVTLTVPNKNGSYDGDYVIKQYTSLTINTGDTLTVDQPCRGLFIYVQGDATINGYISMSQKGASANPTSAGANDSSAVGSSGIRLGMVTASGSSSFTNDGSGFAGCGTGVKTAVANAPDLSSNGTIYAIARTGAGGGNAPNHGNQGSSRGGAGSAGSGGSTGGGGAGGDAWGNMSSGTDGGAGTCFTGGAGGGGWNGNDSAPGNCTGSNTGGQGGGGATNHNAIMSGGAGNPYGQDLDTNGSATFSGGGGLGGIIWLVVGGNVTIGASGGIIADGGNGRSISSSNGYDWQSTGGGGGGGSIHILYKGSYTNNGTVRANGGGEGTASHEGFGNGHGAVGGDGGAGSVVVAQVR